MKESFYITTPIYYPSGKPHIGTAYTTILTDAIAKFKKMQGYDVRFLTGSDEHGQKIEEVAKSHGMSPQEYTDKEALAFKELWELLEIDYDQFIRTTSDLHTKAAAKIFDKFMENEDIYLGKYEGWYCTPCETFFSELELDDGMCPMCNRDVEWTEEDAYFFNMKKYEERLKQLYEEQPDFIIPLSRKNEIFKNFIEPGLEDLCVSRTSFDWGIPIIKNPEHVIYVWVDALSSYITSLGYMSDDESLFNKYWPANLQIVGKDIIRFHAIYWPIFLMALDLELPKQIYAHAFFMAKDGKMSKSKGNAMFPDVLAKRYGVDATKFGLLSALSFGQDSAYSIEDFIEKYNVYLANDLGNLLNRTIGMLNRYLNGIIPDIKNNVSVKEMEDFAGLNINSSTFVHTKEIQDYVEEQFREITDNIEKIHLADAIENIFKIVDRANKYIDKTEPWIKQKNIEEGVVSRVPEKDKLDLIMYTLVEILRKVSIAIRPFMKNTSTEIQEQLNILDKNNIEDWNEVFKYNLDLGGIKVIEEGKPIFKRIDKEEELEEYRKILEKI